MLKKIFFKYILPIVVIFISSIFLVNADFFAVKDLSFVNTKNTDRIFLAGIAKESMEGKYFGLYNKNNFLFYPESEIENSLKEQEKKIKSVNISYSGWTGNIEIDVEEKAAAYLYCAEKKEKCYFMESDGKIFTEFIQSETGILKKDFLVFVEKIKDKNIPAEFLPEAEFEKIIALIGEIKNISLEIKKVEKKEFGEIVFSTKNGSKIIITEKQDFSKIPDTLVKLSSRKSLKIDKNKKDFAQGFAYMNLSFGESIYVCILGEECENNY